MTKAQMHDFAATKETDLPEHVKPKKKAAKGNRKIRVKRNKNLILA